MKTLAYFFTNVALALAALAQAQTQEIRRDIEKDIPLAEGIRRANEQCPDAEPLTEQEVIAAVQAMKLRCPEIEAATYGVYQRVVKERVLPKGMYFSRITAWHTSYGHYVVDWRDLTLRGRHIAMTDEQKRELLKKSLGVNSTQITPAIPNQGVFMRGFNYRIRAGFISSQPLTEREAKAMKDNGVNPGTPQNSR